MAKSKKNSGASDDPNVEDMRMHPVTRTFAHFAQKIAGLSGHPVTFLLAVGTIAVWLITGPLFNYSDTWQLIINTGTTIVTFLMVFLIQNTQNRDTMAMQIKLSELVLAMKGAEDKFATIEDLSDEELHVLHAECKAKAELAAQKLESRAKHGATAAKRKPAKAAA